MNHFKIQMFEDIKNIFDLTKINGNDIVIVSCLHLLESAVFFFYLLLSLNIKKENFFLLGKPYSTDLKVYNYLLDKKFFVSPFSIDFKYDMTFDKQFDNNVKSYLNTINNKIDKKKKIIIIDDGSFLIKNAKKIIDNEILFAVEQTAAGANYLKETKPDMPVFNVAQTNAKLTLEYNFITKQVFDFLKQDFSCLFTNNKNCLIIGNGFMGKNMRKTLDNVMNIDVYDINQNISCIKNKNFNLKKYDLIIGTTGKNSFKYSEIKKLKDGCILASISSSDREFDAINFRRNSKYKLYNLHDNIVLENGVVLLNGGFPLNFTGSSCIHIKGMQLTYSLMLCAILQGLSDNNKKNGLINISKEYQDIIKNMFLKTPT